MAHRSASYRWQGAAMLRAPTLPDFAAPTVTFDPDDIPATRKWLTEMWQREDVRSALRTASLALSQCLDAIAGGERAQPRQVRRAALKVASYLLRWQHRPTPFGVFAGTAPVSVGTTPGVRWTTKHRVVVRADAEWITDIIQRLQQSRELLKRLPLVANNLASVRGDRLLAPGPPADGQAVLMAPVEVSVRNTRPVQAAIRAAQRPIPYGALYDHLRTEFPKAAGSQVDTLLGDLIAQNFLITSLWAPMTTVDAMGHVCTELERVNAHDVADVGTLVTALHEVRADLTAHDPHQPVSTLGDVTARMLELTPITPAPLLIDVALDCHIQIPEPVVEEAQTAVTALHQVTLHPYGHQHWRDYHRRFRARYGAGAAVPVMDLVSDSGLGLPAEFVGSDRGRPPRTLTDRDDTVLALMQQALMEGRDELVLTDAVISDLSAGVKDPLFVPRVEVAFEIHAVSPEALARGAFQLMLTGVPRPGSSMAGRFAHLLPPDQQEAWARTFRTREPQAISAQLSFLPRRRRNENITRTPRLLPHVITLSEHRPANEEGTIPLADIAVTANARRLQLVQISSGRPIDVRVLHALEAGIQTPPLARFLAEIATARSAVYKPFDFAAAARLPYLPRVRYRRTVLNPARWLLTAEELPGRAAPTPTWEKAFAAWRDRWHVPDRIAMVKIEQRLPLDLSHTVHRRLLRSQLDEARRLELRETAGTDAYGWIGRPHEILLPLDRTPVQSSSAPAALTPVTMVETENTHLPGIGKVLCAQLHAHPQRYDEILDQHVPALLAEFGDDPPLWWFTRHREMSRPDAAQHLSLYLDVGPDGYGAVAERVGAWAGGLRRQRLAAHLALATYEPQWGRYGHGPVMDAAHTVFAADSVAAITQIRTADQSDVAPQALAAASTVDLTTHFAASPEEGLAWLAECLPQDHGPLDRGLRDQALGLADPNRTFLKSLPGGEEVVAAWRARATALSAYHEQLASQRDPFTALRSLLHLHHIRALRVDPDRERITIRLARACALRRIASRGGKKE
ncbi:lantibiotic dehydratase [Streptomyces griseocarneus]|nr:lantibiotic dehydratase [Streptomyces griseocarneus]